MKSEGFKLTTPILFLVFNRLDTTKKVFAEIRKAKPTKLYLSADGPRNHEEKKKTEAVRTYILKKIDWRCEVKTLFREKNLGCKYSVSGAIDWFFKNVEQGIILEDDCLPSQSFFRFCQEMLEKYKETEKIMMVSGQNPLGKVKSKESYLFSENSYIWGWATWKRAWKHYNLDLSLDKKLLKRAFPNILERIFWNKRIKDVIEKRVNTWDTSLVLTQRLLKAVCIVPTSNLIENIGFSDERATHTKNNKWDEKFLHRPIEKIYFPLKHPEKIVANSWFDIRYFFQDLKKVMLKKIWPR